MNYSAVTNLLITSAPTFLSLSLSLKQENKNCMSARTMQPLNGASSSGSEQCRPQLNRDGGGRCQDTKTLRYDWFIKDNGTECEVHEAYLNEEGLFEHNLHVLEARTVLFRDYAFDHQMTVFGEVSQKLRDLMIKHAGGISLYSFLQGLETAAAVSGPL